jgi:hypothetical protein
VIIQINVQVVNILVAKMLSLIISLTTIITQIWFNTGGPRMICDECGSDDIRKVIQKQIDGNYSLVYICDGCGSEWGE